MCTVGSKDALDFLGEQLPGLVLGVPASGNVGVRPHGIGAAHAITVSNVAPVTLACATAQCNACRDDSEPSMPMTITLCFSMPVSISPLSYCRPTRGFGFGGGEPHGHDPKEVRDVRPSFAGRCRELIERPRTP